MNIQSFNSFIQEGFQNAIGSADPLKTKYADQVFDLLQTSYSKIGGIKGNGFKSKDDMIKNIPMWKMAIKDGKVEAVVMYKDKGGRKSVAMGSTGSSWARIKITDILSNEVHRSYGEKSKASLGSVLKLFPETAITPFLASPKHVQTLSRQDITPIASIPKNEWPEDAKLTISKYPYIEKYGYLRDIGGQQTFKVMLGTTNKKIV